MYTIRGATTVLVDNKEEIINNTMYLLNEIIKENEIEIDQILSVVFTATIDLQSAYPAVAAREIGITNASLMCLQEMFVKGSLEKCIRVMFTVISEKKQKDAKHIYLNKAKKLRPDLLK